jgi:SAM-dependent methyltransferase
LKVTNHRPRRPAVDDARGHDRWELNLRPELQLTGFVSRVPWAANSSSSMLRKITKWFIDTFQVDFFLGTRDRTVLEGKILPWLSAQSSVRRVLFVGCEWYTYGYKKWFRADTYWTLDHNPRKKLFGSPRRHLIDSMANLAEHFKPESLDLIICNGVFGWGLDTPTDIDAAFSAVQRSLRPGGLFLLGWNDVPNHCPVPLEDIVALRALSPAILEPLGVTQFRVQSSKRHVYNLYIKP